MVKVGIKNCKCKKSKYMCAKCVIKEMGGSENPETKYVKYFYNEKGQF